MKSWIVLLSVSMLSAAFFVLVITSEDTDKPNQVQRSKASVDEVSKSVSPPTKLTRSIATIAPLKLAPQTQFVGLTKEDIAKYPPSNKRVSDWKQKFLNTLKVQNSDIAMNAVKIKHKRSIIKKENKTSRNLEHIVVRLKLANGNPFSYEALVDSETGTMIRSWNKTRYERREPTVLDGTNKLLLRSN